MCEEAMESEMSRGAWSCLSCGAVFASSTEQRAHYKEDWHRYNLKRRVAGLGSVPRAEYERRAAATALQAAASAAPVTLRCEVCNKSFSSDNALSSHLHSRRHRLQAAHAPPPVPAPVQTEAGGSGPFTVVVSRGPEADTDSATDVDTDSDTEELDSDEWEHCSDSELPRSAVVAAGRRCLFCKHAARTGPRAVRHMEAQHSFFIPDQEYCSDVPGLISYLRDKIELGCMCIWCSERGRAFRSPSAARRHMAARGHCRPRLDHTTRGEYVRYYDYSASYPTPAPAPPDEEVPEPEGVVAGGGWELALPWGRAGHRDLLRYYRQRIQRRLVPLGTRRVVVAVRGGGAQGRSERRATRHRNKATLRLALKANKFQPHYRPQVNF